MPPQKINSYDEIEAGLNAMQPGYAVYPDPNQNDRVLIVSPTGEQMNITLRQAEEYGQTGKTWLMQGSRKWQGKVITPELNPMYETTTGRVSYSGTTSSQNAALIIDTAFVNAKERGVKPDSSLQQILSTGEKTRGISPAPSLPYSPEGRRPASERKTLGSVGINLSTDVGRAPHPEEAAAIWTNLQAQIGRVGTPGFVPTPITGMQYSEQEKKFVQGTPQDRGGYPMSFERMSQAQMMLSDKAVLLPQVATARIPTDLQVTGQWPMANDPKRLVKAPNLSAGVETVSPYRLEAASEADRARGIFRTAASVQAGVTTDISKPSYAYSNVLLTGESEARAYERRRMVFGVHPVAGAVTTYEDPNEVKADFWGREKTVTVPMKGVSLIDLMEGRAKINLDETLSRPFGGGQPVAKFGTFTPREGAEPENITATMGPGLFRARSRSFVIPKYIDKITGLPADYNKEMARGKPTDIITTDAMIEQLQKQLAMPIIQEAGLKMGVQVGGTLESNLSMKGLDIKAAQYGTGAEQKINIGGQDVNVSGFTGELKGTAFATGYLGGLAPRQLKGLMRDFSKTFEGGKQFYKQFRKEYGGQLDSGLPAGIDLDELAGRYARITGEEGLSGQAFGARVFEKTIRAAEPGSAADIRNIRRYGAGYVPEGTELSTGIWNPEQLSLKKESWAIAQREVNPKITQKAIDRAWEKTFREGAENVPEKSAKEGYRELFQIAGKGTHTFVDMLTPNRMEYQHGRTAGLEFLSGLSTKFPEFASWIGANIDTFKPQGKTQQAAFGLLQYGIFQGQRREQYVRGESLQMPTSYQEVGAEKMQSIAAFLEGADAKASSLEKLQAVSERFFKDTPEGQLLWNPETKTFLPNPSAMLGLSYKKLGVEATAIARPLVKAFSELGNITSPENEFTPVQMAELGMEATQGLYGYGREMMTGRGEFFKRIFSRNIAGGLGGRVAFDPGLAPNERRIPISLAKTIARGMGFAGGMVGKIAGQVAESAAQMVGARHPMMSQDALMASTAVRESEYASRIGEERARNIARNPRLRNAMGAPGTWAQETAGDWDFDPYFEVLGLRRNKKTSELERIQDLTVAAEQTTLESARRNEAMYFADKKFRAIVNADVQQLKDIASGKDVMGNVLKGAKSYSAFEAFGVGVQNMLSKTLGMGVGYNPRRGALASMAAGGYSGQEISNVLSTVPTFYQPALDKLLMGQQAAGVPAAATLAKSYFSANEGEEAYLKLGANDAIVRHKRAIEDAQGNITYLPEISSGGIRLDVGGLKGLATNRMAMLTGTSFLVEQFAKGGDLSKGGNARMSPQQVAGWFARPGEREALAKRLGEDSSTWGTEVGNYYQQILAEKGDLRSGLEQIYSTPAWGTVLTNAASKAVNRTDLFPNIEAGETGEQIPGSFAASQQFAGAFSEDFRLRQEAAVSMQSIGYRGRGMNLRGMRARSIQAMVMAFPETNIVGRVARTIARNLNVPWERPEFEFGGQEPEMTAVQREQSERNRVMPYYNQALQQGYTGTYEQFAEEQRQANTQAAARSAAGQYTRAVPEKPAELVQAEERFYTASQLMNRGQSTSKEGVAEYRESKTQLSKLQAEYEASYRAPVPQPAGGGGEPPIEPPPVAPAAAPGEEPPRRQQPRARTRRPVSTVPPATVPTEGERVQQESERIPFYKGESDEVAFSIRRSDAALFGGGGGGEPLVEETGARPRGRQRMRGRGGQALPLDAEIVMKLANRVGTKGGGILIGELKEYLQNEEPLAGQLDPLLTELGYERPPQFTGKRGRPAREPVTYENVRRRLEQAYVEKPTETLAALASKPKLYNQLLSMQGKEADVNYLLATMDSAPGLAERRKEITELTASTQLKEDISIGGWFAQAAGGKAASRRAKNPYTIRAAADMAATPEFEALYSGLQTSGVIGNVGSFGAKETSEIRRLIAQQPGAKEMLRLAGQTSTESPANIPSKVSEVRQVAKAFAAAEGSGALGDKANYIMVSAEAHERLTKALEKQSEVVTKVTQAHSEGNEKLKTKYEREKALADLEVRAAESSFLKRGAQQELAQLRAEVQPGEAARPEVFKRMGALSKQIAGYEKTEEEAGAGIAEIKGEEKWGQAARRMLGGFGMMYMRSIANFATSGWGYGMQETQGMRQQFAAGAYGALGQARIVPNQQQALQNQMALQGVNFDPRMGFQQLAAANPWARDIWTPTAAGIGAWGYTQFAASQIGGPTGKAIAGASPYIGMAAAGLAMAGDVYARAQDPALGTRIGRAIGPGGGAPGINDMLAYAYTNVANREQLPQIHRQGELARQVYEGYSQGLTVNDLLKAKGPDFNQGGYFPGRGLLAAMGVPGMQPQQATIGNKADVYSQVAYELQSRNLNWTPETATQTAGFLMRTPGLAINDPRLQQIAADYQMGGFAQQGAQGLLQAGGFSVNQMYRQQGTGISTYSQTQLDLAGMNLTEEQRAQMAAGLQYAGQLQGARYIPGFGVQQRATTGTRVATAQQFGAISGQPAGEVFAAQQAAWYQSQQAGLQYTQPQLQNFITPEGGAVSFSVQQAQEAQMAAQAQAQAAQQRMQIAQNLSTRAATLGQGALGQQMYGAITALPQGQEWLGNRILNAEPMAMAALAAGSPGMLSQLAGPTTIQGTQLNPNIMAMADLTSAGRLTGLPWGRTSFRQGDISAQQMGRRIFGNMDNASIQAAVNETTPLYAPVTLASGQTVESVGGTMSFQQQGNQLNFDYQMGQIGLQRQQQQVDYAYQMQLWGLQDQQRGLGFQHTMAGFGFQQQGMALQQQGMQQQNVNWWAQTGLQQRQVGAQRDWTRQDWAFNAETRGMQWGWKQEDFQENLRFMSGRERRLAERQMGRETILHDREGEQIDKQKDRQEELWGLEDERFELQKKAYIEQYELSQKQFELQQQQFDENKQFFLENKKIEDEIIALQREHWLEQHRIAEQQLALTEEHAKATLILQQNMDQAQIAMELMNAEAQTLADDSLVKFQQSIMDLTGSIQDFIIAINPDAFANVTNPTTGMGSATIGENAYNYQNNYIPPQIAAMNATNYSQPTTTTSPIYGQHVGQGGQKLVAPYNLVGMETEPASLKTGSLGPIILENQKQVGSQGKLLATIIVNIGEREFDRYIVETVTQELS